MSAFVSQNLVIVMLTAGKSTQIHLNICQLFQENLLSYHIFVEHTFVEQGFVRDDVGGRQVEGVADEEVVAEVERDQSRGHEAKATQGRRGSKS